MTDIMIPLSKESKTHNLQLRIALRSIAKYAKNLGKIYIYSALPLPWVKEAEVIVMGDPCVNCKDVNLIDKVLKHASNKEANERFMFWSDDQVLMKELDLDAAPVVMNNRGWDFFCDPKNKGNKWYQRMANTLKHVKKETGMQLAWNYDSHVPQPYRKQDALDIFKSVPYKELPGFCINTIYYGMLRQPYEKSQQEVKHNFEKDPIVIPKTMKIYAGYNDTAWNAGLGFFLIGYFYEPCKYEANV